MIASGLAASRLARGDPWSRTRVDRYGLTVSLIEALAYASTRHQSDRGSSIMASPDIDLDGERALDLAFPRRMGRTAFEASLPRAAYVDETFLDAERERVWWAEWVAVGREEQLAQPGDLLSVDLAGDRVIVVRTRSGGLAAHYDVCRHRGSRLTTA